MICLFKPARTAAADRTCITYSRLPRTGAAWFGVGVEFRGYSGGCSSVYLGARVHGVGCRAKPKSLNSRPTLSA